MKKLDPEKLILELGLTKDFVFNYLENNTIKDFMNNYSITKNKFNCIVNYWGGYKTPEDKRKKICKNNGSKSVNTEEQLYSARKNGSRSYELLSDVLSRIDYEEFIYDYYTPMSKTQLAKKYNCTKKMINKIINYYNLYVTEENFKIICKNSVTKDKIENQKEKYKNTMLLKYGVDNYWKTNEFKEKLVVYNNDKYGVDWYTQSKDFRLKFKPKFKSYYCDNTHFDSSWELIYWIYNRDHNIEIKREPIKLNYYVDGVLHTYYPDFLCNNNLIEIKGSHMLDENKKLKAVYKYDNQKLLNYKQKCMDENNVIILTQDDLTNEFNYFIEANYKLEDFKINYE